MRLTIFGATGGTGVLTVRRALDAGHEVTAVVRDTARLPSDLRACADVVQADVMDPAAIEEAVKGRDAVLSALGTREGRAPTTVCADGTRSITTAMTAAGADRFVLVSASGLHAGPGDDPFTRFVVKPLILQPLLRHAFADMRAAEDITRGSGLHWTIVRPPRLTNGPGNGRYRKAVDRNVLGGASIARADLASALLDVADDPSAIGHVI
ncbi:NAD(P)-dependent oxidoreductase, partial [Actinomadura sp.]|uniref:NAD(P)-dependent oxidoreductase n=2 Tax=Actinomadura sp. TaxID=1989 RepID=UPI0037C9BF5F